ncbi:phage virion morphogenesis protein [Pseudomonas cremoricolorata]|uniref:phage virion morphogenesis protein n=1 Tax=Pseudomonas cremoricolorata TaxID=157783 RepID=UPI0003FC905E|nr:phage virion morphogenesis protein [Pseudomonas cremoricolorata]
MADLQALENWLTPLLQRLEPAARRTLARDLAQQLRRSQQQRIGAQRNTDGSTYAPRKQPALRDKRGRVRNKAKMFRKLRTTTHLKARGDATSATVGFAGRVARIAKVHQRGLRDRPRPGSPAVKYPRRELLGLTERDVEIIRNTLLDALAV